MKGTIAVLVVVGNRSMLLERVLLPLVLGFAPPLLLLPGFVPLLFLPVIWGPKWSWV